MVEENKSLAGRLDGDLQIAHSEMALLRAELNDTNKRISTALYQQSSSPPSPSTPTTSTSGNMNFSNHSDEKEPSLHVNGLASNGDHNHEGKYNQTDT